jgi:hypothetical protein
MNVLRKASYALAATALLAPSLVFAQAQGSNPFTQAQNYTNQVGSKAGLTSRELPDIIGQLINIVLGFMGILLLAYLLYAGFLWMTAGGDSKQVDKAKDMIRNAIIGLIIIVASFAISNFVLTQLVNIAQ